MRPLIHFFFFFWWWWDTAFCCGEQMYSSFLSKFRGVLTILLWSLSYFYTCLYLSCSFCPFLQILLPLSSQPLLQLYCQQKPLVAYYSKNEFFLIKKKLMFLKGKVRSTEISKAESESSIRLTTLTPLLLVYVLQVFFFFFKLKSIFM